MKTPATILTIAAISLASCSKEEPVPVPPPLPSASTETGPVVVTYPLTTCVVSGEPLGSMGEPVVVEHAGTTVKFCCKTCLPKFNASPDTYIAKLH